MSTYYGGRKVNRNRRKYGGENNKVNFTTIFAIILLSIALGYFLSKYILYPVVSGQPVNIFPNGIISSLEKNSITKLIDGNKEAKDEKVAAKEEKESQGDTVQASGAGILVDQLPVEITSGVAINSSQGAAAVTQRGYSIQYGSFTAKVSAEKLLEELKQTGITAQIVEKDGAFKVVGQIFADKAQAAAMLPNLAATPYKDAFIATI